MDNETAEKMMPYVVGAAMRHRHIFAGVDVEDLVGECWVRVIKAYASFNPARAKLQTFVWRVCNFALLDYQRRLERERARLAGIPAPAPARSQGSSRPGRITLSRIAEQIPRQGEDVPRWVKRISGVVAGAMPAKPRRSTGRPLKRSPAERLAWAVVAESEGMSVRALSKAMGVSKTTSANILNEFRDTADKGDAS